MEESSASFTLPIRRLLGRLLIAACAMVVLTGLVAIFQNGAVAWKLVGSSVAAVVALGVIAWQARQLESDRRFVGAAVSIGCVLLGLILIWLMIWASFQDWMSVSFAALWPCGIVATMFAYAWLDQRQKLSTRLGVFGALLGYVGFVSGGVASTVRGTLLLQEQVEALFGTGAIVLVTTALAAFAIMMRGEGRAARLVFILALLGSAAALILGLVQSWMHHLILAAWLALSIAVATVSALLLALQQINLIGKQRALRITSVVIAASIGLILVWALWDGWSLFDRDLEDLAPILSGLLLVWAGTTVVCIVFGRLNRKSNFVLTRISVEKFPSVAMTCPRCQCAQQLPINGAVCVQCKLYISVSLAAARCGACGYDLVDLQGNTCPECGSDFNAQRLRVDARA